MITEINDIMRNSLSAKRVFSFLFPLSSFLGTSFLGTILFLFAACTAGGGQEDTKGFVTIKGHDLIQPNGGSSSRTTM